MISLRSKLLALTAPGVIVVGLGAFYFVRHTGHTLAAAEARLWDSRVAAAAQQFQSEKDGLRTIVFEYALWDGMVSYIKEPTEEFEQENLGPWLKTFHGLDYTVVLNAQGEVLHAMDPTGTFRAGEHAGDREEIRAVLARPGVDMVQKVGRTHVWFTGGSVHPTSDVEFEPPGVGTFLCGRIVSENYLSELGRAVTLREGSWHDESNAASIGELPLNGGGNVRFMLSRDESLARASSTAFFGLAIYFLLCVIGGIAVLVLAVDRSVVAPVLELRRRVGQLRSGAGPGSAPPKALAGEIGQLAQEFDALADDLGRSLESISDGKRLADTLTEQRDAAEAANRAKTEFLATMSHEIRTPMNGLLGMTELLLGTPLSERQRHFAETSYRSGRALLSVLDDLLVFSKIEAGKLELEATDFRLKSVVEEVATLFELPARQKGIALQCLGLERADLFVRGDSGRIRQVLCNLVANAVKFTSRGSVTIRVVRVEREEDRWTIELEVVDTGIGIDPSKHSVVFDRFIQADSSTTRKFGGTGLGLSICKRLVEMMDGSIALESEPGRGATFTVTVRLETASDASHSDEADDRPSPSDSELGGSAEFRILLVEDNPVNAEISGAMLEASGYEFDLAANGREAVELVFARRYDVVLMDCHMPEMDGLEATRSIRRKEAAEHGPQARHPDGPRLPIVALTAYATESDQEQCREAGMDAHLSKPFSSEELRNVVERFGRRASAVAAGTTES